MSKQILRALLSWIFRAVDFLDSTFRLCLSRSVENLLLTSSLALLDSTLPKIRQNDDTFHVILSGFLVFLFSGFYFIKNPSAFFLDIDLCIAKQTIQDRQNNQCQKQ